MRTVDSGNNGQSFLRHDRVDSTAVRATGDSRDACIASLPEEWPNRPTSFSQLLTPVEAAQYLRLDETGRHNPKSAIRTLNHFRDRGELRATKYARRVWYCKAELDRFLVLKTQS